MKVALVHDWLTGMRGGEKCLEVLCELFPDAPLFTLVHIPGSVSSTIEAREIHTSFIQNLPSVERQYRRYLPLFPSAIERFDMRSFDLIMSTSHCVAKGAIPGPDSIHICYCHTPMRYVWDQYEEYFGPGRAGLATRMAMRVAAPALRAWDIRTTSRVHRFVANSENVRKRINRIYHRDAEVIVPPVDITVFSPAPSATGPHLMVTALVPYKRVDIAIEAFNVSGRPLVIVGKGPDRERLERMARPNISFLGWRSDGELAVLYRECRALIFPGEEDFGIVPLEAMASGRPVIAYGRGGALETVREGVTGTFFREQTPQSLQDAIDRSDAMRFDESEIRRHAETFSRATYTKRMSEYIDHVLQERRNGR